MKLNNLKLGLRLNLILSAVVIILLAVLGIYNYNEHKKRILEDTDIRMYESLDDLVHLINLEITNNKERVNYAIKTAHEYFFSFDSLMLSNETISVNATDQITLNSSQVSIYPMELNGTRLYNSNVIVDEIQNLTGATATIFQKIQGGYLRISTNVRNIDGERAIPSLIRFKGSRPGYRLPVVHIHEPDNGQNFN